MQVLMITEKDASCMSLAPLADAFIRKGHHIVIYAIFNSKVVLREFHKDILICDFDCLTDEAIEKADIIFTTAIAGGYINQKGLFTAKKPIFTQNYLINKQMVWGGDICFNPSNETTANHYIPYLNYSRVAIGDPKYDNISKNTEGEGILFIDSGHYPFGMEGKQSLARLLLDICKEFPDIKLTIKPRFLPDDDVVTHTNKLHLYDVIKSEADTFLPENLEMLYEHKNLTELICQCRTVICMYTTAFSGAVAAGKGLIILDNIPSDDTYDLRKKTLMYIRENMEGSGAIIDYRMIKKVLPYGTVCADSYKHFLNTLDMNVSEKIVEISKYLVENFYAKNVFPRKVNCEYMEYLEAFVKDSDLNWNKVIQKRYTDFMILKTFSLIDFRIKTNLNIGNALKEIEQWSAKFNKVEQPKISELKERARDIREKCIIENADLLVTDDIDYGILLNALFYKQEYNKIKNMDRRELGADYFYRAKVAFEEKDFELEYYELKKFFEITIKRSYIKEISDMSDNKFWGFSQYITLLIKHKENEKAKKFFELMKEFFYDLYKVLPLAENINNLNEKHYLYIEQLSRKLEGEHNENSSICAD